MKINQIVYIDQKIVKQRFKSSYSPEREMFPLIHEFRLKEKKVLEQSIAKLRTMNHDDEEIKRQLYTEQIKWWIQQADEDITALKGKYFPYG